MMWHWETHGGCGYASQNAHITAVADHLARKVGSPVSSTARMGPEGGAGWSLRGWGVGRVGAAPGRATYASAGGYP